MDAMSFCRVGGGGGRCICVWVLLQGVAIISAYPNPLTGDEKQQQQKPHQPLQQANLKFFESSGCDVNPCRNGGVCTTPDITSKDTILCVCPRGYYGEFCDYDAPECETEPCFHNGECLRSNSNPRGYECLCPAGFIGDNCEVTLRTDSTTLEPPVAGGLQTSKSSAILSPVTVVIVLVVIFFILAMAFVATVEADRKVLTERYRVLISVGYRVEYPHIEFYRLAAIRLKFLCCCICYMIPCCTCGTHDDDDDDAIPLPPNMRGFDPCSELRSIVESTAGALYRVPSQQSQLSLYGRASVAQE